MYENEIYSGDHKTDQNGASPYFDYTARPVEEMNGERDFAGVLSYYENGEAGIILDGTGDDESDGTEMRFELGETAYVRLADDFDYGAAIEDTDDSEED